MCWTKDLPLKSLLEFFVWSPLLFMAHLFNEVASFHCNIFHNSIIQFLIHIECLFREMMRSFLYEEHWHLVILSFYKIILFKLLWYYNTVNPKCYTNYFTSLLYHCQLWKTILQIQTYCVNGRIIYKHRSIQTQCSVFIFYLYKFWRIPKLV